MVLWLSMMRISVFLCDLIEVFVLLWPICGSQTLHNFQGVNKTSGDFSEKTWLVRLFFRGSTTLCYGVLLYPIIGIPMKQSGIPMECQPMVFLPWICQVFLDSYGNMTHRNHSFRRHQWFGDVDLAPFWNEWKSDVFLLCTCTLQS